MTDTNELRTRLIAAIDGVFADTPAPADESAESMLKALLTQLANKPSPAPVRAKADDAPAPRLTGAVRRAAPVGPTANATIYRMRPGFDKSAAKEQRAINGKVLGFVLKAGDKGINARTIAEKGDINPKSVQSAIYHLRHARLIRSHSAETGKPLEK